MHNHPSDEAVSALAGRQHGVVSLTQLRALGVSGAGVTRRIESGRLHRLYPGVYAVGHTALTRESRELAAVLACGAGAVLSHRAAGRRWGLVRHAPRVDVTCRRTRPPARGVIVHRSQLGAGERSSVLGIPITTVPRTLVDLADVLTQQQLGDAIHEAEVRRLFDLKAVDAALRRLPGRRGRHRLHRVLAGWKPRPFTRSEAERRFLGLCEEHGLPVPLVNISLHGHEVDFLWPDAGLVLEIDGAEAHLTRRAFTEDRRRDRELAVHGLTVMRATWADLEPGAPLFSQVAAQLTLAAQR
jgi:hypothetical protein